MPIRPSAPQNGAPLLVAFPAETRHLELCALKSLAIRSEPALHSQYRGATLSTPTPLASECPRHGILRTGCPAFPLQGEAAPLADARPDRCAQPCPEGQVRETVGAFPCQPVTRPFAAHGTPRTSRPNMTPKGQRNEFRSRMPDFSR